MAGILDALLDAAALTGGEDVLDVGCGTGAATIAAARRVPGERRWAWASPRR